MEKELDENLGMGLGENSGEKLGKKFGENIEIERKFLTLEVPLDLAQFPSSQITQSYISFSPTIRIRQSDDVFYLTVKGKGHMSRVEFELEISHTEYERLRAKVEGNEVRKRRFFVPLDSGFTAEVDIYEGELLGLMTTEVEFSSLQLAEAFEPPLWFGEDVTRERRYKNTMLALHGKP